MPVILALDSSTNLLSVALQIDQKIIERESSRDRWHEERLQVLADELLAEAGISAAALTQVLVGLGPGSFTGLRVGLSFAKGLTIAGQVAISGYLSPAAFAANAGQDEGMIFVIGDARREEIFLTVCSVRGEIIKGPALLPYAALDKYLEAEPSAKLLLADFLPTLLPVIQTPAPAKGLLRLHSAGVPPMAAVVGGPKYVQQLAEIAPFYLRLPSAQTIAERA